MSDEMPGQMTLFVAFPIHKGTEFIYELWSDDEGTGEICWCAPPTADADEP